MVQQGFWKGFCLALAFVVAFMGGQVFAGNPEPAQSDPELRRIANALDKMAQNSDYARQNGARVVIEPRYSAFPVEINE